LITKPKQLISNKLWCNINRFLKAHMLDLSSTLVKYHDLNDDVIILRCITCDWLCPRSNLGLRQLAGYEPTSYSSSDLKPLHHMRFAKGEEGSFVLELTGRQRTSSTGEQWTNAITAPYGQHRLQTHLISLPLRTSDERHQEQNTRLMRNAAKPISEPSKRSLTTTCDTKNRHDTLTHWPQQHLYRDKH